jgi:hypothetical protein
VLLEHGEMPSEIRLRFDLLWRARIVSHGPPKVPVDCFDDTPAGRQVHAISDIDANSRYTVRPPSFPP